MVQEEKNKCHVGALCRVLRLSRSGYYAWRKGRKRENADAALLVRIRDVHAKSNKAYGSPRVYRALRKEMSCSKRRVERLMRENGIRSKHKRRFKVTTNSKHNLPLAPNILAGRFSAWERPNQVWVGDITYIPTAEGWLYLSVLLDLFSRRIVGWAMDKHMTLHLPLRALKMAIQRREPSKGLIHHSDRGSQYASHEYRAEVEGAGMICSMSAKGRCYDNAVAESFFHNLKVEIIHGEVFSSREQARKAIFKYMEVFYNRKRMHSTLNYMSPVDYERSAAAKVL
jgi:putative transposase